MLKWIFFFTSIKSFGVHHIIEVKLLILFFVNDFISAFFTAMLDKLKAKSQHFHHICTIILLLFTRLVLHCILWTGKCWGIDDAWKLDKFWIMDSPFCYWTVNEFWNIPVNSFIALKLRRRFILFVSTNNFLYLIALVDKTMTEELFKFHTISKFKHARI